MQNGELNDNAFKVFQDGPLERGSRLRDDQAFVVMSLPAESIGGNGHKLMLTGRADSDYDQCHCSL